MNFKEATDELFSRISHDDLSEALGVSVASIRQARLDPRAKAYREPPSDWENAVFELAQDRAKHYSQLILRMQAAKSGRTS